MVVTVLLSGAAAAATLRVPQDYPTIQAGLDAASLGDHVVVAPGVWGERIDFRGKDLVLESLGGPTVTTIQVPGGPGVRIGPFGSLLGFTISGATGTFNAAVEVTGAGSRIAGNVIQDNTAETGGLSAGVGGNNASPTIDGNIFRRNSCDSQLLSGVVAFINTSSPVVTNNLFDGNNCRAINMTLPGTAAPRVMNNTIVGNPVGIHVDRRGVAANQVYRNNILVDNVIGLETPFGTESNNPVWQNNLVFRNGTDYDTILSQTGVSGNISADPQFRGAATGDFRLVHGSPAIDAGSGAAAPSLDFDGRTRPSDGNGDGIAAFDIGAFEFGRNLLISPPSGTYLRTQRFDLALVIPDGARATSGTAVMDGQDVSAAFVACAVTGRAASGILTLRCPGVSMPAGRHTLSMRVNFNDGSSELRVVQWDVTANTEP